MSDDDFSEREKRALRHLAQDALDEMPSRRTFLGGAGSVAGAVAAGAVGYNEGVSQAQAAASTSDGDGDVGTPSNPVDVFADGVDAVSVGADGLNSEQWVRGGDSIADAIAVASTEGRTIHIAPSYDPSVETLPVVVDTPVVIKGPGGYQEDQTIDASLASAGDFFFEVNQSTVNGPQNSVSFHDIHLSNAGYEVVAGVGNRWENCVVSGAPVHAWHWPKDTDDSMKFINTLIGCYADSAGNTGYLLNGKSQATDLIGCGARFCDTGSIRTFNNVQQVHVWGGSYEKVATGSTGIDLDGDSSHIVGAYLEADDTNTNLNQLVNLSGQNSGVVLSRINGVGAAPTGVRLSGDGSFTRDCVFNNMATRAMNIAAGADVDINHTSHQYISTGTVVNPGGTRDRSNGIIGGGPIGGVDIGSLTGATAGDVAMADGTTGSADAYYVLKSSGDWQALHDPTTTITPA